ncbi:MAG: hypothetical protein ACXAEU_00400 [Candidatus Hodarchaeales archaeon]|jgi:NH3-dependent NAD+ synthetase
MSVDDNLKINPIKVESKIIEFIRSTLEPRGIEGLVVLFKDFIESLVNVHIAISAVGRENVKLIVTQGRFSSRKPTKEKDLATIKKYVNLPQENIIQIDIENLLQDLSRSFLDKSYYYHGLSFSEVSSALNYNLSFILLRDMIIEDFDLQKFTPPAKKPITDRDKFIQRSLAHYKSQIRLNMLLAFLLAESENKSFIGHTNKTEWLLGLFTKFGTSHAADFLPLVTLYKTQVVQLAEHLGLKEYLDYRIDDIPTRYKYFFNLTFREVDRILIRLESGKSEEVVFKETDLPLEAIKKINFYYKASEYARNVPLMPEFRK